ncbi:MAG: aldo/keto reductase [Candidatus Latescibacterota bacterium]|nr:aldo/keto reductase [Candidatus Latescibacterota bacterium]
MPLNHYVTLGRSGLRVSPLCLGAMTFGEEWGCGADVPTSTRIIDAYVERGGNFIDTANVYTQGHSEKILGDHVGRHPHKRDRLVIATKFMGAMHQGDPNSGGAGRKAIMAACEESLRRLQTDYIDLYWLHFWDRHTPIEETLRAFDDLVTAGKIRYVGFSDVPAWKCAEAQTIAAFRNFAPIIALQIEYSLIERTVENELMPMARALGMGVTPWSPLKGGILTGKFTRNSAPKKGEARNDETSQHLNERTFAIIDALTTISKETGASIPQVAIAWVMAREGVASTIIGARNMKQLEDNLAAADVGLSPQAIAALDEASHVPPIFPQSFLTFAARATNAGTTINGEQGEVWPLAPKDDKERW